MAAEAVRALDGSIVISRQLASSPTDDVGAENGGDRRVAAAARTGRVRHEGGWTETDTRSESRVNFARSDWMRACYHQQRLQARFDAGAGTVPSVCRKTGAAKQEPR